MTHHNHPTDTGPQTEDCGLMRGTAEEAERIDRASTQAGKDLLFMLGTHEIDDLNMEARILAIEAEAQRLTVERLAALAVRFANHGKTPPPNDPCGSCALAADEVVAALAQAETRA